MQRRSFLALALPAALAALRSMPGVHEVAILSTCNRTELYAAAEDGLALERWLAQHDARVADPLAFAALVCCGGAGTSSPHASSQDDISSISGVCAAEIRAARSRTMAKYSGISASVTSRARALWVNTRAAIPEHDWTRAGQFAAMTPISAQPTASG